MRFGQETLYLEGWCARTQYNACCRLLGPGINIHLAENQLLREIFHLGNKVLPPPITIKTSKLERVSIRKSDRFFFIFSEDKTLFAFRLVDIDERGRVQGTHHSAQQES